MPDESHTRPGDSPAPSAPAAIGFACLVRHIALVGVAGLITGLLVAGGGGRLLMRIAAIAGHDDATGRLTDSGFRVGETTLGGTLELVLFIGLFAGGIGTILYLMSEPWLVWAGKWRGVVFGGFLLAVSSATSDALDPDNFDFELLGNKAFIVAMFVVLFLAYGGLLAWLSERLEDRARPPDPDRPIPVGYGIPDPHRTRRNPVCPDDHPAVSERGVLRLRSTQSGAAVSLWHGGGNPSPVGHPLHESPCFVDPRNQARRRRNVSRCRSDGGCAGNRRHRRHYLKASIAAKDDRPTSDPSRALGSRHDPECSDETSRQLARALLVGPSAKCRTVTIVMRTRATVTLGAPIADPA